MPKSKVQKQEEVAAIVSHLKEMQSAAVATSAQVKVKDERSLRAELKKIGARMTVVKKTLLQRALKELNLADDAIASLKLILRTTPSRRSRARWCLRWERPTPWRR